MFPFKYSSAAILEIDYLQTALQMIFCEVPLKNIHYSSLTNLYRFPLSSTLAFLFSLFIALFLVYILLSFSLPTVSLPLSTFHQQWLFSAQLPYALGTDLNHKKTRILDKPRHFSVHHPTHQSPPIISSSPSSLPAPSLHHSIPTACV